MLVDESMSGSAPRQQNFEAFPFIHMNPGSQFHWELFFAMG
jgi:hypothetical protein